jgi:hypothetical protein
MKDDAGTAVFFVFCRQQEKEKGEAGGIVFVALIKWGHAHSS